MNSDHYILLLYKKLRGKINSSEAAALEKWLEASEENKAIAHQVETSWQLGESFQRKEPLPDIDLDKEFERLERRLPKSENLSAKSNGSRYFWLKIAAGLALIVGAFFLIKNNQTATAPNWVSVKTGASEQKGIVLPDGSEMVLNENSAVRYLAVFDQQERLVELDGEAFFKVNKNPEKPFHVNSPRGKVSVLGTAFNVRDVAGAGNMAVQVKSGKVKFQPLGSGQSVILQKAEKAFYDKGRDKIFKEKDHFMNEIAWYSHKLYFAGVPLQEAIRDIEKYYGVKISVSTKEMLSCSYSATFNDKKLADVFETFQKIYGIRVIENDPENYRLEGGNCPTAN